MPEKKKKQTKLTEEQINKYIDGIYAGTITADNLSEEVYLVISNYLKQGLYKGFGMDLKEARGKDLELLEELRNNVYMFGAAKDYAMTKEISSLLLDENGDKRTLNEFQEVARQTYDNWNNNWGESEYSTAIGQGYNAIKWQNIEQQKEALPLLRYSAIGDACPICMPFDGLIAPVDDPIWDTCAPMNHFNCKCLLLQEGDDAKETPQSERDELLEHGEEKISPAFASNPAKDGMIFNENHPYFEEARADGKGKDNFGFDIPKKD